MAITYQSAGSVGVSAAGGDNSFNVPYPASIAAGDILVLITGRKPSIHNGGDTADLGAPWQSPAAEVLGGGYAAVGNDTGNTGIKAQWKVADGTETGNLTVTVSQTSVAWGQIFRLSNATGAWSVAVATGSDTSAGNVSVTFGSDPGVKAGDYILGGFCIPTDVTTPAQFSAQALSQTGITFGTVTEVNEPDSATGSDVGGFTFRAPVDSGTSSAAPVLTATAGGTTTNVRGPAIFVRIRELAGIVAASASYTYTATAAGLELGREVVADSAAYAYTATAASLERGREIVADAASYAWTATAAALEFGREIVAEAASFLWNAADVTLTYTPAAAAPEQPAQPTYGAAPHTLDPRKVYAKYEEIEAIERSIRAKEEAEREKIAALEQEKRRLADLALKKRQTKTLLERRRKLEARIAAYQGEIAELRAAMVELLDQIERLQMEAELQQTVALRRRRLLLAVATAA
jgi:hypothetical protein